MRPTAAQWEEYVARVGVTSEEAARAWMEMSDFGGSTTTMHSSINRAGESRALGAVGDVGTREAVGTTKGQRDIANQMAFKKVRERLGFHTAGEFQ